MRKRWSWLLSGFVAIILTLQAAPAFADPPLNDARAADLMGIAVPQLHSLRSNFNLSNEQFVALQTSQLQTMLWRAEHPGFDPHSEEQRFRALHMQDEHGHIPSDGLLRAINQRLRHGHHQKGDDGGDDGEEEEDDNGEDLLAVIPDASTNQPDFGSPSPLIAGIGTNRWTWLGPGNVGGRVRSIVVSPADPNTIWCGGVDGGVWKSTNAAVSWFPLNDFMANLAISCMVMDPIKTNVLYAGTGEGLYNIDAIRGAGIFRTTDGGNTWLQLPSTAVATMQYVNRLAIDPTNSSVILAATRNGIFRSADAGSTWSQRSGTEMLYVAFCPTNSLLAIASGYNSHVYYSADGGQTWLAGTGLPATSGFVVGRVELTYSPADPTMVYASFDNASSSSGQVYRSTDGGHTYSLRATVGHLGAQGWYDNAIWADPINPNVVIVGGTDLYRSTDGGGSFVDVGGYSGSVHPDQHCIISIPQYNGGTVRTIYVGNDGGVFRANDAYTATSSSGWQNLNHNLGITQFYGAAGNPTSGVIVGGTQDNGTPRYTPSGGTSGYTSMFGGDGGYCASDQANSSYFYGEYVYLQIHRSSNGGASSGYIYPGIGDAGNGSLANFIAPFILDPNNQATLLAGGSSLWRTTNARASTPSWTSIKPSPGSPISAIAVAPGNSAVIWVGHNSGAVYFTTNGTAASPTWTLRTSGLPGRMCTRLAINPTNSSKVYATFGGYNSGNVLRTVNSGLSWTPISGNLPAAPVSSIVLAPGDPNTLYVGTEVGVYASSNDGGTWSTGNDGPANVAIDELFWVGSKLVAATHGRGMFSITPNLTVPTLIASSVGISGGNANGAIDPNECNLVNLQVRNVGGIPATNITAVLTTTTPGVSIVQGVAPYADLAANTAGNNLVSFQVLTTPGFACGTPVLVDLAVTYSGMQTNLSFALPSASSSFTRTTTNGVAIIPGTTDIGNHGDDDITTVTLPFPYTYYGQTFTTVNVSANGNLQFASTDNGYNNSCLPYRGFAYAMMPLWDDLRTDDPGAGIFTSVTGTAPNRVFNIEWRANYYAGDASVNFEVCLYENQPRFDFIYGNVNGTGSTATIGVERDTTGFSSYACNGAVLSSGLQISYQQTCTDGGGACAAAVAGFDASPTIGAVPLTVTFNNTSSGAVGYVWDFGDGSTSILPFPSHTYTNAGTFSVSLLAYGGGVSNVVSQPNYITATNVPPGILAGPVDQVAIQGSTPSFTVTASGTLPLTYQWRVGGQPIGSNSSALALPSVVCAQAGSYDVIVSNGGGSITSSPATLTIIALPAISLQPTGSTIVLGQSATLRADATTACGDGLIYQWRHNQANVPGATGTALQIQNAQFSDAGDYTFVATNLAGGATSQVATITVLAPALLAITPLTLDFGTVVTGALAQASFTVSNAGGVTLTGSVSITGGPFLFADPSAAQLSVAASSYTNLLLNFAPIAAGTYSNLVQFVTTGGNSTNAVLGVGIEAEAPVVITPSQVGADFLASFATSPGRTYTLQFKDNLDDPTWQDLTSVPGDGTFKTITNSAPTPPHRFYRLSVQ